jgi:uncharacterized YccA/Bax inhibitor family protein
MALRNPNPVLSKSFDENGKQPFAPMPETSGSDNRTTAPVAESMTMEGTVNKTGFLLLLLAGAAAFPYLGPVAIVEMLLPLYLPLIFVTIGIALAVAFKPHLAGKLAVAYALIEGLLLGVISKVLDASYPGIASQALMLTIGVAAGMLFLYRARVINVTRNFRIAVTAATFGVFLAYMASILGSFIGFEVPLLHENTPAGILVSLLIVALAAANLAMDFDFIERGVAEKFPRDYEWVGAFGLVVTLAWLYIEILRLLAKLRSRD